MSKKTTDRMAPAAALAALTIVALVLTGCEGKKRTDGDGRNAEGFFPLRAINAQGATETAVGHVLGFFREEGIEIDFVGTTEQGITDFQLLDTNQIDFAAAGHPAELARAVIAGAKIKAIAGGMVDHPDFPHIRYLTQEDSSIKTL
ncbi:MAG: ABC transporter substrate-binding protein, partial [Treponema sp.]|nr:ABC transporter substrate-binding protein [Treponema sp.]